MKLGSGKKAEEYTCPACGSLESVIKRARGHPYRTCKKCALARTETWKRSGIPGAIEYQKKRIARNVRVRSKAHAALRATVLSGLGARCICCGESEPLFLDLDHVLNDGARDRKNWERLYRAVIASGFSRDRYQLLCKNCNWGKYRNGGACPHLSRPKSASDIRLEFIGRTCKVTA